jgi:hypothetical protein
VGGAACARSQKRCVCADTTSRGRSASSSRRLVASLSTSEPTCDTCMDHDQGPYEPRAPAYQTRIEFNSLRVSHKSLINGLWCHDLDKRIERHAPGFVMCVSPTACGACNHPLFNLIKFQTGDSIEISITNMARPPQLTFLFNSVYN